MVPLAIDPKHALLAVAGNGPLALRRLLSLRAGGAEEALLFADDPEPMLAEAAGVYLRGHLPDEAALADLHVLWIVDLPAPRAAALAGIARRLRVLVNVEDVPPLCDFHSVAEVRRGALLLTVSTNGAAPGLARLIRRQLEARFGAEWEARIEEVAALRRGWQREGVNMAEAMRRIEALVDARCWLSPPMPR
ncbi:MAG: siroheme synthase [Acidocella sp. 20-63-7]|nr:MAG: siroheme synthase [Acidocella sp. 20-63-7]HQT46421.1 NAD(P)-dependent oxidoreductase [Acidocella sp.]